MAHTVLLKRSSSASSVPTAGQLSAGELAINTVDEKIYFKNSGGTVKALSAMSDLTANLVTVSTTQSISGQKTFTEHLTVNAKKELRLADSDSSNYVAFTAPSTVTNNNVYTLPSAVGTANQVLRISSVAGNNATLDWGTVSSGGNSSIFDLDGGDSVTYTGVPDIDGGDSSAV